MDQPEAAAIVERIAARIRFGVTTALRIAVVSVAGPATGLALRLSWGHPDLLLLDFWAAAIAVYVWFMPEEVNSVRLILVLAREHLILLGLRIVARRAELRRDRLRAAEAKVDRALVEARAEQVLAAAGREPQREPHDVRVYPPRT